MDFIINLVVSGRGRIIRKREHATFSGNFKNGTITLYKDV